MNPDQTYLFFNPSCSKCREAKTLLEGENCAFETIEYLTQTPDEQQLREVLTLLGISAHELIRKGEPIYQESYQHQELSNDEWIRVMTMHPILIERPILIHQGKAIIGRPPARVLDLL